MRIERIAFGLLVLDGRTYASDLLIYPDGRILEGWRRARGHRLTLRDIEELVAAQPEVLVAGTGVHGLMRPEADLEERLFQKGIRFLAAPNDEAMNLFNEQARTARVGGCFHLTC